MSAAGGAAAAAAIITAIRAIGVIVKVEPDAFQRIVERQDEPLVVRAPHGLFSSKIDYVVSYKGLAFFTSSKAELHLPASAEVIRADSMYIPG